MAFWRLAHPHNPYQFVPRRYCSWNNRFDDPKRDYRTLYGAQRTVTCLRELLADLRPNAKAVNEFEAIFGGGLILAGVVSTKWRREHVLVNVVAHLKQGRLVALEAPHQRKRLEEIHQSLLSQYGIKQLTIPALRARQRPVTRAISRTLYEEGHAGISFHSRLDRKPCYAFFEGRVTFRQLGKPVPMTENHADLITVCGEYTLVLRA